MTHIGLEDFFLTSSFPDFLTPPVGGFINNTGITANNYELYTYNATLHNSAVLKYWIRFRNHGHIVTRFISNRLGFANSLNRSVPDLQISVNHEKM
jgi:hypothetical protein